MKDTSQFSQQKTPSQPQVTIISMAPSWLGWCLFCTAHRTRNASKPALNAGAKISASAPSGPAQHSAGASRALENASIFLDTLPASGLERTQRRTLDTYLAFVEQRGIHRVRDHEGTAFEGTKDTWGLIRLAATRAKAIYHDSTLSSHDTILKPVDDAKKVSVSIDDLPGRTGVIVVAIRGTKTFYDWLVNLNKENSATSKDTQKYHDGFFSVATKMRDAVGRAVSDKPETITNSPQDVDLLFTGHSAGGAVAKLLYTMASWSNSPFTRLLPKFGTVHCIAFGLPPIAAPALLLPQLDPFQSGLFLNIVNEGDPIVLAQKDYIHFLLQCFANAHCREKDRSEMGELPPPVLRLSGTCIVPRDVSKTFEHIDWRAVTVPSEILEGKLFGNPIAHQMDIYVQAIGALTSHLTSSRTSWIIPRPKKRTAWHTLDYPYLCL